MFKEKGGDKLSYLYMICADLHPAQMVDCTGFKSFMSYLEPGYQISSRKYFTSLLQQQYLSCKEVLITKFEKEAVSIALTTDIWTSRAVEAYISVIAHYLDPSWKMQSYVLKTSVFPERHTGIEIAGKLKDISNHFKITSKVSVMVHDQASNMSNSLDLLESELGWKSLKCSPHCLKLCLKVLSAEFYFHKLITLHLELYLFYCFIHFVLYIGQY